jgi:DnaJ like chaperone protein
MGYWGKIIGGMAGFAMGGPMGAVVGAALGHAADAGVAGNFGARFAPQAGWNPARLAAMFNRRDQLFAICVVVLSAKLAKCDGPVRREEIDAFKRQFRIPPESVRDIGRLFDQARDSAEGYEAYALQLGDAFADNRGVLEDVLAALFAIARADGAVSRLELDFLSRTHRALRLDQAAWDRARSGGGSRPAPPPEEPDAYAILGVSRSATDEAVRATWKRLMRENHPDSLAARGVPAEFIARANDKVARINAAWDRIKRERGL